MIKIIITGPESSGKTTLCTQLSHYFNSPFAIEYAREYISNLTRNYKKNDLVKIAKEQCVLESLNSHILFCDTDLITIKIWSLFKYKICDNYILDKIEEQKSENRFYLLCKPNIPWESDPQRENPNNRQELFEIYKQELENLNHNYIIVEGSKDQRAKECINIIKKLIIQS